MVIMVSYVHTMVRLGLAGENAKSALYAVATYLDTLHLILLGSFEKERRILMLGLDAAGKTTVIYKLKLGEFTNTLPTIGFNVEKIVYKKLEMTMWDVGGQDKIRQLWRHYYQGTDALIFVVDAADPDRLEEAAKELKHILNDDLMRDCALLILANKMDLPGAMSVKEIVQGFQLSKERSRPWFVQPSIASRGDGLYEGLDWVANTLRKSKLKD